MIANIILIFFLFISSSYAALTVNNVPKTKVGSTTPTLQDSTITDTGNVGIGSTAPGAKLDVQGAGRFSSTLTASNLSGTNTGDQTNISGNAATATALAANGANCSAGNYPLGVDASGAVEGCTAVSGSQWLTISGVGIGTYDAVGIGTINPGTSLDIQGTSRSTGLQLSTNPGSGYVLVSGSTGIGTWMSPSTLPSGGGSGTVNSGTIGRMAYYASTGTTVDGLSALTTDGTNVGIGTTGPQQKLEVSGTAQMTGFKLTTNPSAGYVLTSGSTGIGTWMPVTGGGSTSPAGNSGEIQINSAGSFGSVTNTAIDSNGNIGIGTTTMGNNLSVLGGASIGSYATVSDAVGGMIISGNVGIGTVKTLQKLDVRGNQYITGSIGLGTWLPSNKIQIGNDPQPSFSVSSNGRIYSNNTVDSSNPIFEMNGGGGLTSAPAFQINYGQSTQTGPIMNLIQSGSTYSGAGLIISLSGASQTGRALVANTSGTGPAATFSGAASGNGGNVGIGTIIPKSRLVVAGGLAGIGIGTNTNSSFIQTSAPLGGLISESNVGIGTVNPGQVLDVNGNIRTRGTNQLFFGDDNKAGILASATTTPDLRFMANSTEAMRVTNGNNVGIGTIGPQALFHVKGGNTILGQNVGIGTTTLNSTLQVLGGAGFGTTAAAPAGGAIFTGNVGIGTTTPQDKFIVISGNIGVGTWAPAAAIDIKGTGNVGIGTANPNYTGLNIGSGMGIQAVGIGTTVPQQLCRDAAGRIGYFNGSWNSSCTVP